MLLTSVSSGLAARRKCQSKWGSSFPLLHSLPIPSSAFLPSHICFTSAHPHLWIIEVKPTQAFPLQADWWNYFAQLWRCISCTAGTRKGVKECTALFSWHKLGKEQYQEAGNECNSSCLTIFSAWFSSWIFFKKSLYSTVQKRCWAPWGQR